MEERARRLRQAVVRLGRKRRNEAIPRSLRVERVREAQRRRRAGQGWRAIAEVLGVSGSALQRGCAPAPAPQAVAGMLQRVRVQALA